MTMDLPPERAGFDAPELAAMRAMLASAVASGQLGSPAASGCEIGGLRALRFGCGGEAKARMVHFHGGGYRQGMPEMGGAFAEALARSCPVEVICPAYRLAPEHPFPAAIHDGWRVVSAPADGRLPLILSGDSAGGGLAAALALLCTSRGIPLTALTLHSPWLDLSVTSAGYERNRATDPVFSKEMAEEAADLYLQGLSADHPLASPLFGEFSGLPPAFISVGEDEVLIDDSLRMEAALTRAGVPTTLVSIPGMEHTAVARDFALTGAWETFDALVAFIRELIA